jgi:hypothetical protein
MTVYGNRKNNALLTQVEFAETPSMRHVILHLRDNAAAELFKQKLLASDTGLALEAESHLGNTKLLVLASRLTRPQVFDWLEQQGDRFELVQKKQKIDPWIIRSVLGFGGQTLQLTSSLMRPNGRLDPTLFIFATANMTANIINFFYKAQDLKDPHRLRFLKEQVNRSLVPHLTSGAQAIAVDDERKALREKTIERSGIDGFLRRHSVNVGELGLRYLGAFGLAVPYEKYFGNGQYANNWWGRILKGKLPELNGNPLRQWTGLLSMGGKTLALGSKFDDPYNPSKRSWLDGIREKFTFVTGGLVEAGAFSLLAYDAFFKTRIPEHKEDINKVRGIKWPKKIANWLRVPQHENGMHLTRDWLGGVGAAMFVTGYIVRSWAKYGERSTDMKELYAHASDMLAQLPPEKIPQILADTAADICANFKGDKPIDFSTVYAALAQDLERYHPRSLATQNPSQPRVKNTVMAKESESPASKIDAATAGVATRAMPRMKPIALP